VLGLERAGVEHNFFELGGDSILSLQIVARARQAGMRLSPEQLFRHPTIAALASVAASGAPSAAVAAEQGPVTGPAPLTPIQAWFFERELAEPQHWNQAVLLEVRGTLSPYVVERACRSLLAHHDALRFRFTRAGNGHAEGPWQQVAAAPAPEEAAAPLIRLDLSALPPAARSPALGRAATSVQASLDLARGPLLRAAWFDLAPGTAARLLIAIHHLVIDAVSWRLLLEDLQAACEQIQAGSRHIALPPKTTSFRRWAESLAEHAASPRVGAEMAYWLAAEGRESPRLPLDHPAAAAENLESSTRIVTAELPAEETRALLQEVPAAFRTQINDSLLAALAIALGRFTGQTRLLVDLEGHGREDLFAGVDLSRTAGWFTTLFPVLLDVAGCAGPEDALARVRDQLRALPGRGMGYGLLRYARGDRDLAAALAAMPAADVSFNYFGRLDSVLGAAALFSPAAEPSGLARSPRARRSHLLAVDAMVVQGRLRIDWSYSQACHCRETIERLAADFLAALRQIIAGSRRAGAARHTPGDFPLARLDQRRLDELAAAGQLEDVYPLSPMQEGMLFQSLMETSSGLYVEQVSWILRGDLDPVAFRRAWSLLVERHPVLRTAFAWQGLQQPVQVVWRGVEAPWRVLDWRGLPAAEQRRGADDLLREDRRRGFDLAAAPILGLTLIRLAEDAWELALSFHDALLDGWSLSLLVQELFTAYEAFGRGRQPRLAEAPRYRDYIAWLERQELTTAETYWRRAMAGFTAPTRLGIDHPPSDGLDGQESHDKRVVTLARDSTEALQSWARRHRLTLHTLVQGMWAVLLSRYSGEPDVVFGATVAGRPAELPDVERMVGLFINTLPARVWVAGEQSLPSWLLHLQEEQAAMRRFDYAPLPQVHGWSEVPRKQPLFESLFVFENYPMDDTLLRPGEGLRVSDTRSFQRTTFPLALVAIPGRQLTLRLNFDRRRLDGLEIDRLSRHLQVLLAGALREPPARLDALPLLTEQERHQVLQEWSRTEAAAVGPPAGPAPARCIHELFEEQVASQPDALAAIHERQSLTFRQLNRQANRLAHQLRQLDVGPEVPVGVCGERSLAMLVAYLGILKAGGYFVPLDPSYPPDRLRSMLAIAGAPVVLSQDGADAAIGAAVAHRLPLAAALAPAGPRWDRNPASGVTPGNAVYTIFTSGSTGRPKGVLVEHRHLLVHLHAIGGRLELPPRAHIANVSTISADVSMTPIFGALCFGGCLHVMGEERVTSPGDFVAYMRQQPIDFLKIVPSHVNALRHAAGSAFVMPRQRMLVGGEAFFWEDALELQRLAPEVRILNHYGPTETTVGIMTYRVRPRGATASRKPWLPLGRVMGAARLYLVDRHGQPAPIGVPAELWIGGPSVSRGYLGRPEITAERFVPDAFGGEPGARLYRSGDIGALLPDGNVDFLGRVDHQVKVRGFRVELEEIAALLRDHPALREAVVVARRRGADETALTAYLVARGEPRPAAAEIRDDLAAKVPGYMVPAAFVFVDALPLNPNGKVDRQALPDPEKTVPAAGSQAPRTPTAIRLAALWEEVLGVERVGADANFFDLGGHSIAAIRILARCKEAFGVELPARRFFEAQDLAGVAAAVDEILAGGEGAGAAMTFDPLAEAALDRAIAAVGKAARPGASAGSPAEVLLTGATGFVGSFLLHELLRQTPARVHCLVRAATPEEAWRRLRRGLETYGLWEEGLAERLAPLPGDLSLPLLGLTRERFAGLAGQLDAIYHNGALVNFAYPYSALKRPNVRGTEEVLRLAAAADVVIPVHFVSTISVFAAAAFAGREVVDESDDPADGRGLSEGYVQSKWAAERLVRIAGERGLPVTIYRLGRVSWHSQTGAWAETDFVHRLMRSCIQLGSAPRLERLIPLTPVDYVSRALVALSLAPGAAGRCFHLTNPCPVPWEQLVEWIAGQGYPLRRLPFASWFQDLMASVRGNAGNALYAMAALAPEQMPHEQAEAQLRELEAKTARVECPRTLAAASDCGVSFPAVDARLAGAYFAYAASRGLLALPPLPETPPPPGGGELPPPGVQDGL
jgi:amino acid adenylation domain-containing protein/thioester reductase-like protein/non-ribosomal peptide synthase protein (TIGR01720 family)